MAATKHDPKQLPAPSEKDGGRQFTLVLDEADHSELRAISYRENTAMTALVRAAIKDWLARR